MWAEGGRMSERLYGHHPRRLPSDIDAKNGSVGSICDARPSGTGTAPRAMLEGVGGAMARCGKGRRRARRRATLTIIEIWLCCLCRRRSKRASVP
jgi:hypothetical protein